MRLMRKAYTYLCERLKRKINRLKIKTNYEGHFFFFFLNNKFDAITAILDIVYNDDDAILCRVKNVILEPRALVFRHKSVFLFALPFS